jgi:hypothetical protein
VKPYTDYTLTVPRSYWDEPWGEIEIEFFNQNQSESIIYFDHDSMEYYDGGTEQYYYATFRTTSNTNYMSINFPEIGGYFSVNYLNNFMLEEGVESTGYEQYIEGDMIDTSAPYFQTSGKIISYVDQPITIQEIQSALTAYDAVDGDVTSSIQVVTDNYSSNANVLGTYNIVFEVSDQSGNTSDTTIIVEVVDILCPVFSEIEPIQAVFPNVYTSNELLNMMSASDNYDGDISNQIVIISDNYTANANTVGEYQMIFSVTDSSDNITNYTQIIQVIDNENPIISGVTEISIGYDNLISVDAVKTGLSFNDNYDEVEELELILVSDSYTDSSSVIGVYQMLFSVTDSSGNKTDQIVTINVVDEIGPVVYFNKSIIQTYDDVVMSLPDFVKLLRQSKEIDQHTEYLASIRYDSYTKNAKNPGTYHVSLLLKDNFGGEISKELEIRVVERPYDSINDDGDTNEAENDFLERNIEYIIGFGSAFILVVSNVVWALVLKKRT